MDDSDSKDNEDRTKVEVNGNVNIRHPLGSIGINININYRGKIISCTVKTGEFKMCSIGWHRIILVRNLDDKVRYLIINTKTGETIGMGEI